MRERLSATVDAESLRAARAAVDAGRADSVSEWVNTALRRQAEHDLRMLAFDEFISAYEAEHGVITDAEIRDARRSVRANAHRVTGRTTAPTRQPRKARRA